MNRTERLRRYVVFIFISLPCTFTLSQKVGIGTSTPQGELHIKGTENLSQLCIDADTNQNNLTPMIRLRKSNGTDVMWITSHHASSIFIGVNAGRNNETISNIFIGEEAGYTGVNCIQNIGIGNNALRANVAHSNTAIGYHSLQSNTTGAGNTAVGASTMIGNTNGASNTAMGKAALASNSIGSNNSAYGFEALTNNFEGGSNTAVGSEALRANTFGNKNSAVGYRSLTNNHNGNENTAVGYHSLLDNTDGTVNVAIGAYALENNLTGNHNCATGYATLSYNNNASYNSAYGSQALRLNTTGAGNAAFGFQALYNNTTQVQNTALGNESLFNTTASGNTAVGFLAGHDFDNGDYNTYLGIYADANAGGLTNSTAIGSSTNVTASNQVRIGTGVTSIGGPQNWTNTSDGRIKLNVRADVPGLAFISLLQPVTYNKSNSLETSITGSQSPQELSSDNPYEKIRYSGFIAQEVEAAAQSIGYEFSGVDAPLNDKSLYGLRYAEFVVPLVKAVQEQQAIIAEMQKQIQALQQENAEIRQLSRQIR